MRSLLSLVGKLRWFSLQGRHRMGGKVLTQALLFSFLWCTACSPSPAQRAADHRSRAERYLAEGKVREASVEYQSAIQSLPTDADAIYGFAQCLSALGEQDEYRRQLARAVQVAPDHFEANLERGRLQYAAAAYEAALESLDKADKARPGTLSVLQARARVLFSLGRVEEARGVWQEILKGTMDSAAPYVQAAQFEAGAGSLEQALQIVEQGLIRFPGVPGLLLVGADLKSRMGNMDDAYEDIEEARRIAADNPLLDVLSARLALRQGDVERFSQLFKEARAGFTERPESALHWSDLFVQMGRLSTAVEILRSAREGSPENPAVAANLADLLIAMGQVKEARSLLQIAKRLDPSGRLGHLLEANIYMQEGKTYRALLVLEMLVAKGDASVQTHFLYARALAVQERWAQARSEYVQILNRAPEHVLAREEFASVLSAQRDYGSALAQLERLPDGERNSANVQLKKAKILLSMGDPAKARVILETLSGTQPDNAVLIKLQGDAEVLAGRKKAALSLYQRSKELRPEYLDALLAEVSLLMGERTRLKECVNMLEGYMEKFGDNPIVLNRIAMLFKAEGEMSTAHRYLDHSLLVEPNYWKTRVLRAKIFLAEGEKAKAMVELDQAIGLNSFDPEAYLLMGAIYRSGENYSAAEETYLGLLNRHPGDPGAANDLADLYLRQGKIEEGLSYARQAFAGAPKSGAVADTLGWALHLAGDVGAAASYLQYAAGELPKNAEVQFHWGLNLQQRGEQEQARRVLMQVLEMEPSASTSAKAKMVLEQL